MKARTSPSENAQRRAWEAAFVLLTEYPVRIPPAASWRVRSILGASSLGWESVCFIHVLFGRVVEDRQ